MVQQQSLVYVFLSLRALPSLPALQSVVLLLNLYVSLLVP